MNRLIEGGSKQHTKIMLKRIKWILKYITKLIETFVLRGYNKYKEMILMLIISMVGEIDESNS